MNRIDNAELLLKMTELLTAATKMTGRGEDPQFVLIGALVPLQLHLQRSALLQAREESAPNRFGWPPEKIDDVIHLIDAWLEQLNSDNVVEEYEAEEVIRTYYSPYRLMLYLQELEEARRLPKH